MKTKQRILRSIMSLAVALVAVALLGGVDAQAKSSYKYDSKNKVIWQPAIRASVRYHEYVSNSSYDKGSGYKNPLYFYNGYNTTVYVDNSNAKVTASSSSSNLLVKVNYSHKATKNSSGSRPYGEEIKGLSKDKYFKSTFGIEVFAKEEGTYTVTVKIKSGKKTITKKIKVYATEYGAVKSFQYANTKILGFGGFSTTKKSGKLKVKMNKGYKLTKLKVGTYKDGKLDYEYDRTNLIKWKKVGNGKKVSIPKSVKFTGTSKEDYGSTKYEEKYAFDYLNPVLPVRITYTDKVTGETNIQSTAYIILAK